MFNRFLKKIAVLGLAGSMLILPFMGMAQNKNIVLADNLNANSVHLVADSPTSIELKFSLNQMELIQIDAGQHGEMHIPYSQELPLIMQKGNPELLYMHGSVIIPNLGSTQVVVEPGEFVEYQNVEIAPSKGHLTRDINPATVPFEKGESYEVDGFFPGELASLRDPYILRDFRGQTVEVYPLQYNPVTKTLRVYKDITVKVVPNNDSGVNEFVDGRVNQEVLTEFHHIYNHKFLNYATSSKYTPIDEEGLLLVVAYDDYLDAVKPLVNWKNQKGQPTRLISYAEAGGTSNNLKQYIVDQYNSEEGLMFVLLVGDGQHIPPMYKTGDSDAAYGHIMGNDSYAEAFIGRFSAESIKHVEDQVQKTIVYERDMDETDTWITSAMGIASNEGGSGGDNGESDIQHMDVIRGKLLAYTYETVHKIYQGQSGATSTNVVNNINDGVTFINYTGHGSQTSWVTTGFGLNHMGSLTNVGKYPHVMDVACVNGDFNNKHCFAEGFARATTSEGPTGTIAIFAATVNQSWAPPMRAQDEFTDIMVESYENHIKRTYGGLAINACMEMNDVYGNNGVLMTNTWVIFGDPSFVVRTDVPAAMSVNYNPTLFLGSTTFNVACDVEDALVAISYVNDQNETVLLSKEKVTDGSAQLVFDEPITAPMDLMVTVTAYNKITHVGEVSAVPADEPYVVLKSVETTVAPDFGKSVSLNMVVENISEDPFTAGSVTGTLSSETPYVTITNATESFGNIAPGAEAQVNGGFAFTISDNVPDQTVLVFTITFSGQYGGETYSWAQNFNIKANAPVLTFGEINVDDTVSGNGDNVLDPGESGLLFVDLSNNGHADISDLTVTLSTTSSMLTIDEDEFTVSQIEVDGTALLMFSVTASDESTPGTVATLNMNITSGGLDLDNTFEFVIGFVPEYCPSGATSNQWSDLVGFTFGPLENFTEPGGTYDDFTDDPELVHEYMLGFTYPVSVSLGSNGTSYTKGAKVFIDWNYDGQFIEPSETALSVTPKNENWTAEGTITIPEDAPLGQKFVRVVVRETNKLSDIKPCGTFSWGGTEDYRIILVEPKAPEAEFTATPTETLQGGVVNFTDLSEFSPFSWSWTISGVQGTDWKFVDETSATSQHPKVQFLGAGKFNVSLTVTNPAGNTTETKNEYITIQEVTEVPVAGFTVDKDEILPGDEVKFTDISTNMPLSWSWVISPGVQNQDWRFVEGTNSTSQHPQVRFNKAGNYTIRLTATNVVGPSEPHIVPDAVIVLSEYTMHTGTITTCHGMFYDSGGASGNYSSNENHTLTVFPKGAETAATVTFLNVDIETDNDLLEVYNGSSATGEPMAIITGKNYTETLEATNAEGALTFVFKSNGTVNRFGWVAKFGCKDLTVGISNGSFDNISLYPNPFSGHLTLQGVESVSRIEMFNLLGQKVHDVTNYGQDKIIITTTNLQSGIYLVRLISKNGTQTTVRLIKQ